MVRSLSAGMPALWTKVSVDRDQVVTRGKVRTEAAQYPGETVRIWSQASLTGDCRHEPPYV